MVKKSVKKKPVRIIDGNNELKTHAFIVTFLSIIGFLIALLIWKDEEYTMFYGKQSLVIFLVFIVGYLIMIVPIIGIVIATVVNVIGIIFWVISFIFALSGEKKEVPFIGQYAKQIKI